MQHKGTKTWEITRCPSFKGLSCFVLPGAMYGQVVAMMASVGFRKADSLEDADLVVFIGGADVSPYLYGQLDVGCYGTSKDRDEREKEVYEQCKKLDIPMFGICRGAQFLHVMNGGTLWQDVSNHAGPPHFIVDLDTDVRVFATSLHHQMIMDNDRLRIIAVTENQVAYSFKNQNNHIVLNLGQEGDCHEIEIEAAAYDDTNCLLIQGHPEVGCDYYKAWTMHRLHDFIFNDVGIQLSNNMEQIG